MKPYYADSSVTIYHGDCNALIESVGNFDLLGDRFPRTSIEVKEVELVTVDKELALAAGVKTLDPTKAVELIYKEMQREIAKLEKRENQRTKGRTSSRRFFAHDNASN